ncbi:BTAD domain-containing putative transcriptional regulator [Streptomyces albus]|uniref:AfsR/SARP family transcriptional regulator n=1 Tax=Streptomyces albus TaxID=1888 RepID=UPI0033C07918
MGERLSFEVLGPLAVTAGRTDVPLGGGRQRTILALLLLTPGRVVPVDTMVDAVWNSNPPPTARTQVAICVAALRKIFKGAGADGDVIVTAHPGYRLNTEGHSVDATDFQQLLTTAEQAVAAGELPQAARCYTQALALWRGPAFAGVPGRLVEDEAARLEEHRLNAYDDATQVQLELGRHQELIPQLAATVREHPLRERTRHHLMLAQYRSGRRADAMETYRDARSRFIDELGIEPGPGLQELHDAILRDDPALAAVTPDDPERGPDRPAPPVTPATPAVPSELPPDVPSFTGRAEELAALEGLVADSGDEHSAATVGLVTGAAGIGKSGLAMRWAFRAAAHFPDGQLFADLHGYDAHRDPAGAHDVLSRFLRSLGVPGEGIPADLEERIALYRSLLADRRVLIVLDNARSYAQIRPLLPGGSRCCVLVTSRDQLEDLVTWPPQARVHLGLLSEEEAVALLTAIVGERRIATARADAARLVELCDRLPLALRIAAARLASKPHWTVRYLANRLSDERRRLDELSQGESQVRAGLALSYRYLPQDAARLLRRLGLLDVPDFTAWAGAALLDVAVADAERLIEDLVDAQFLEVVTVDATGQLRYRLHTLVRLYARERAQEEETDAERHAARTRFLRTFLTLAEEADQREGAGKGTGVHSDVPRRPLDAAVTDELLAVPLEWYEAERAALVASVRQAARTGEAALAWDLTVCASVFFGTRSYTDDWGACCEAALEAARAARDARGQGAMHYSLGTRELGYSRMDGAAARFAEALRCYGEAQEDHGRAMTLRSLGQGDRIRGDLQVAMARFEEALPIFRRVGNRFGEAHTLHNMAETELDRDRPDAALGHALEAVRIEESRGSDTRNLAQALYRLGRVRLALGQAEAAEETFLRAVRIVKEKADMIGLAHALLGLGETRLRKGETKAAETTLTDALEIAEECRSPLVAGRIGLVLGEVSGLLGRTEEARALLRTAQERFAAVGATAWERRAGEALGTLVV